MAKRRKPRNAPLFDGTDGGAATVPIVADPEQTVDLIDAAESRYLNYALSVITSRALIGIGLVHADLVSAFRLFQNGLWCSTSPS